MGGVLEMSTEATLVPSRALVVSIGESGVTVPRQGEHPALPLGVGDLSLLSGLSSGGRTDEVTASVAGLLGLDPSSFDGLLEALDVRGLLKRDVSPAPGTSSFEPHGSRAEPSDPALVVTLDVPLMLRLATDGAFEQVDHDGRVRLRLVAAEVAALGAFSSPVPVGEGYAIHQHEAGPLALSRDDFGALVDRLVEAKVAERLEPADVSKLPGERRKRYVAVGSASLEKCRSAISDRVHAHLSESGSGASTGSAPTARTRVVPIHVNHTIAPLALGMLFAYAKAYDGGRLQEHYDFVPSWLLAPGQLPFLVTEPSVVLVSNYVWSHSHCLTLSERVKELSPGSVTVHGGPDTPKYEADVEAYFRAHPHVDVAVRGEGERTTAELLDALAGRLDGGPVDLSILADVPGLSYRDGDHIVRTPDRERIADLDTVPSPYLTGLFDGYAEAATEGAHFQALVETNRGCPYGCTFCDWGSATLSRVRKFSQERVFAELEWCARNGASVLMLADANFGMMPRDVAIAEKIAELKDIYGCPDVISLAFAKNSMGNRKAIIEVLVKAGIMTEGVVSLQSLSDTTLAAVERKNIKVAKYDDLATQFRRADLPLWVELMLGLPGSTVESFRNDLQDCIEREVPVRINLTELLVNSPMNAPDYKERFQIETARYGNQDLVVSTSTFTRRDRDEMLASRRDFLLFENLGILRQVSRFVRQETGMREIDLYRQLGAAANEDPERWPAVAFTTRGVMHLMAPPVSWRVFIDEVHDYLVEVLGIADDSALRTVLEVQHALLPAHHREFPVKLELAHDYVAWHRQMLEAKENGHRHDWPAVVPRLQGLASGQFVVDDPHDVCNLGLGSSLEPNMDDTWDFDSPVSRLHHLKPIPVVS